MVESKAVQGRTSLHSFHRYSNLLKHNYGTSTHEFTFKKLLIIMENTQDAILVDLAKMEHLLRDKLIELQMKTKNLEELQRELAQARQSLYEMERQAEDERRQSELMRAQLDFAMAAARRWEEEKTVNRCQQIQSTMYSETVIRERDSLLHQTKNLQLENMMLKQKIQEIETINAIRGPIEENFMEMKNKVSLIINTATSEIEKLHRDLENLQISVNAANKLNGRLQAAGMCRHAIEEKYRARIRELENKLNPINQFRQ
ncbi:centromere-associated protein E-like [Neodiprion pinetum]|uniref:centromere-associated protein E-like n=1 Tax=Neodiprion pinetum TaxID=441929 RepID=UPI001EDD30DA|nr:uncharacterized protein LOC124212035 [Neodiprion pinetum]